jgi:5'-phosphate synthase pdxT subunit
VTCCSHRARDRMDRIGVLALQGAFIEHVKVLRSLCVDAVEVRLPQDLENLSGLIIPGGESTTVGKLAVSYGLVEPIRELAESGSPVWGTCAGLIFLARTVEGIVQPLLGLMDVTVARNAFGRQVESFEAGISIPALDAVSEPDEKGHPFHAIFIRAPVITAVGDGVEVLSRLDEAGIVAARQDNLLVTAFHPELTSDTRFHRYFLTMVDEGQGTS